MCQEKIRGRIKYTTLNKIYQNEIITYNTIHQEQPSCQNQTQPVSHESFRLLRISSALYPAWPTPQRVSLEPRRCVWIGYRVPNTKHGWKCAATAPAAM